MMRGSPSPSVSGKPFVWLCAAMLVVALAGCSGGSLIESKKVDYKSAGSLPPLEIPPDLTVPTRDERFAVPDTTPRGTATYSAYSAERVGQRPATAVDILPQSDALRLERSGTQRWLVVKGNADALWPSVKEFWQELGFLVSLELPDAGIMETDWAENRAKIPQDVIRNTLGKVLDQLWSTSERDKFRTRLERGLAAGTTEIYISHRGMVELFVSEGKDRTMWQPRPPDPELEAEMLRRLMVKLGVQEDKARAVLAEGPKIERANLRRGADGSASLDLQETFDRAWRRVGLALDRVGFTVVDRDRSQGVYFVRYVDPEADNKTKASEGFLSKLAFWRSDKSDAISTSAQYRVHVTSTGDSSTIQVLTAEGGVDRSPTAGKILSLLHDQLK